MGKINKHGWTNTAILHYCRENFIYVLKRN